MLVGQNPGAEEDFSGEAFVGPTGRLLNDLLRQAGVDPAGAFFTNAVRCHTLKDEMPNDINIGACRTYLKEEIHRVRPQVIVALGDIAVQSLCRQRGIGTRRQQELSLHTDFDYSCPVVVTYHPAFLFRAPNYKETIVSDLRRARNLLHHDEDVAVRWKPWQGERFTETLAYDIETYREDGSIGDVPTMMAVADSSGKVYVTKSHIPAMIEMVQECATVVVSHNGWAFDDPKTGITTTDDTMAWGYLADENQPLGLESLCMKYLHVKGWKSMRGLNPDYCARDARYTLLLYQYLHDSLGVHAQRLMGGIIVPVRRALDQVEAAGFPLNHEVIATERLSLREALDGAIAEVDRVVAESGLPTTTFDKQLKTKVVHVPFDVHSPKHVGVVYGYLGVELPVTAKSRQPKTDEKTLLLRAGEHPFTKAVLKVRGLQKLVSTYVDPYFNMGSRGTTRYTNIRVVTGRTSSYNPNFQNTPRQFKKFFPVTRADYAAIEFWIACWYANVGPLLQRRINGEDVDPHRWFAAQLYEIPEAQVTKVQRQVAKSANFGLTYMGTPNTLVSYAAGAGLTLSTQQAEVIYERFHTAYPEFKRWYKDVEAELRANSFVESPTGRRRHFGDVSLLRGPSYTAAVRESVNAKVQGFATGDIAELGLVACVGAGLPVVGYIHDEVCFEGDIRHRSEEIRSCLIDEPIRKLKEDFGVDLPRQLLSIDITY